MSWEADQAVNPVGLSVATVSHPFVTTYNSINILLFLYNLYCIWYQISCIFHWLHNTRDITHLATDTFPVLVIQTVFSLLPLSRYLLPLTTLIRYQPTDSSGKLFYTTISRNVSIVKYWSWNLLWFTKCVAARRMIRLSPEEINPCQLQINQSRLEKNQFGTWDYNWVFPKWLSLNSVNHD